MLKKIRNSKLQIEYSLFWIAFCTLLIVMSLFPDLVTFFTHLLGIQTPVNMVYLAIIFILIIKLFSVTIKLSELENKVKELTQNIAIEKNIQENNEDTSV